VCSTPSVAVSTVEELRMFMNAYPIRGWHHGDDCAAKAKEQKNLFKKIQKNNEDGKKDGN
jgi:hypothetical protein